MQWEYLVAVDTVQKPTVAVTLNDMGREGWRLISVVHIGIELHYYFGRPLLDQTKD